MIPEDYWHAAAPPPVLSASSMSSTGFQKLRSRLKQHGVAGLTPSANPKEQAQRFIEELRRKNTFVHASGKPVDSTIGVILTNVKVKFVIPGSPGQRPVEGKRYVTRKLLLA